jgi:hypothetical protein
MVGVLRMIKRRAKEANLPYSTCSTPERLRTATHADLFGGILTHPVF